MLNRRPGTVDGTRPYEGPFERYPLIITTEGSRAHYSRSCSSPTLWFTGTGVSGTVHLPSWTNIFASITTSTPSPFLSFISSPSIDIKHTSQHPESLFQDDIDALLTMSPGLRVLYTPLHRRFYCWQWSHRVCDISIDDSKSSFILLGSIAVALTLANLKICMAEIGSQDHHVIGAHHKDFIKYVFINCLLTDFIDVSEGYRLGRYAQPNKSRINFTHPIPQ